MKIVSLHDKEAIERFLRRNTYLHIYSIGDLDAFFWEHTIWFGLKAGEEIKQIVLMYPALSMPTLLAFTEPPVDEMCELLCSIVHMLPRKFYTHLTEGLRSVLEEEYNVHCHGTFYKMALKETSYMDAIDTTNVSRLTVSDLLEIVELYRVSYPGNWFDPRMLETGHYYGVRQQGGLVGVAGIHVYSERYKVAALGNVTTHPEFRGQGVATAAVAKLCRELAHTVDNIGLNVKADNPGAIASYKRLGFEIIATYEECTVEAKRL